MIMNKDRNGIEKFISNSSSPLILLGTFILMFGAAFSFYFLQPYFEEIYLERMNTAWGMTLMVVGFSLLAVKVSFLIYILFLYLRYKVIKPISNSELPLLTVIVPAYNEGELVYKTLISLAESDYPAEKVQILSIDDGSQDDTWQWMKKAKNELGNRVSIYQQPKNKGKRHALYRGFNLATGDVFITVDSDSIVKKDTLRIMASPFIVDKNCGAVAGNVRVLNRDKALIPRMLNVSFAFSFEFIRSAQSRLGSVLCTPGALSAYRKEAVFNCLPDWINQTFMGQVSKIGEDRAMTNMILKQGYKVLFQRNAFVYTNIPERYKNLSKMFIRWERSNIRENIAMSKFAFTDFRDGSKSGTRILLLNQWLKMTMAYPGLLLMLFFIVTYPVLFLSSTLVSILAFSSIQAIFYAKKHSVSEAFWAYPYSVFYAFTLFWITPYAIATAGRSGWLTRDLTKKQLKKQQVIAVSS
ncbi:glycosyltransferase family 2 protein [Aquimarina sp. AD10]|uniref:Glycosyl transferase family 2 n=2 Tax=Flavobacteriaceae TaxID=49546 RepID=A0A163AD32_9FLAO|nr:glycosyltransferase family 2 protein [Aquimarina sp. AD10]KZS40453.1 glycosyl transferase family 2 [Aquimarina aggregata]RKN00765.1 glycosyltransferase family 2 protein [Aquimarina sp. AD10]